MVGCSDNPSSNPPPPVPEAAPSKYEALTKNVPQAIVETQEFFSCMEQTVSSCANSVATTIALRENDPTFCDHLETDELRHVCRFSVVMDRIQSEPSPEMCAMIEHAGYQEQCITNFYTQKALQSKDIQSCKQLAQALENTSQSGTISTVIDGCMINLISSEQLTDASLCAEITSTDIRLSCESMIEIQKEYASQRAQEETQSE